MNTVRPVLLCCFLLSAVLPCFLSACKTEQGPFTPLEARERQGDFDRPEAISISASLAQLPNDVIEFTCKRGEMYKSGDLRFFKLECTLVNRSKLDVFYLSQSCNGLAYSFEFDSKEYSYDPGFYCNATYPIIHTIAASDTIIMKLTLQQPENTLPLRRVGLDLRRVNKFIPFEDMNKFKSEVDPIYRAKKNLKNIIWCDVH